MRDQSSRSVSLWTAVRPYAGWLVMAAGVILEILGWYGVSGETLEARQLPYVASGSIPGAALIVAGAIVAAGELSSRRVAEPTHNVAGMVADLHDLLVEAADPAVTAVAGPENDHGVTPAVAQSRTDAVRTDAVRTDAVRTDAARTDAARTDAVRTDMVALPEGTIYHRRDCELVAGKPDAKPVTPEDIHTRGLRPCPVCDPTPS